MKKHFVFTLLLLLSVCLLTGQTWIRNYSLGGLCPGPYDSVDSEVCNVVPALGGGYLLQGHVHYSWGDIPAYSANVFWNLDENGNIIWRRTGGGNSAFDSIVSNGVDRYYCLFTDSGETQLYVFDNELNQISYYLFSFVNGYSAALYDMQYVEDGLVFAGKVGSQGVILKTDFNFQVIWQSIPFMPIGSELTSIEPLDDGWVAVSSRWFAQFTATGDTLWTYIDSLNLASLYDCFVSSDGSVYILAKYDGIYRIFQANMLEHTLELLFDGPPREENLPNRAIAELPNGNLVLLCKAPVNQLLHSYSPGGIHQWSRSYDTLGAIYFGTGSKNLLVTPDGHILFPMYHGNIVLVKTDPNGIVVANDDPVAPVPGASIRIYPQPARSKVTVSVKSDFMRDLGYSIYNIKGQKIYTGKITVQAKEQSFELPNTALECMSSGVYLLFLERDNSKIATTKLVMVK